MFPTTKLITWQGGSSSPLVKIMIDLNEVCEMMVQRLQGFNYSNSDIYLTSELLVRCFLCRSSTASDLLLSIHGENRYNQDVAHVLSDAGKYIGEKLSSVFPAIHKNSGLIYLDEGKINLNNLTRMLTIHTDQRNWELLSEQPIHD